jgi:uncharacterized OB-fold protein
MTASGILPAPAPVIDPETKPFWDATLEGRLLIKRCNSCAENYWYPRTICPCCGSFDTAWVESCGRGTIYTFAITRKGVGAYANAGPFVLAYVQLEEGPRVMTNIVDCDVDALRIGDLVEVVFHDTGGGAALYRFRPAQAGGSRSDLSHGE